MQIPLVMTIIGKDRTGLVESLAGLVAAHGGNWLESRMSRLGGEFAGILRVHVPSEKRAAFLDSLQKLSSQGLTVVARADDTSPAAAPGKFIRLELLGHDRPGIVREITRALAARQVNVEELASECLSAPMSGELLFKATARLQLPATCDLASLRADLERLASDLMVDISLAGLEPDGKG